MFKKKRLKELNRERCKRYYQRHKQEIKESKKYGSISAYRKHKEEIAKTIIKAIELENKKQEIPLL